MKAFIRFSFVLLVSSCSQFIKTADREIPQTRPGGGVIERFSLESNSGKISMDSREFEKYAFELGLNPAGQISETELLAVKNRAKLRKLERVIQTDREQSQYAKILPFLKTDGEKIDYLTIPSIEGRLAWAGRNKIWARAIPDPKLSDVADKQDIAVGMTGTLVRRAWGEPIDIEASGNPIYRNEKWKYVKDVPTVNGYKRERRFVYFEAGRVIGWETEQ